MKADYKRDMNHNYLILSGEQEVDTSSYQVRMLAGNVLPSILRCRMQGLDGKTMFYYEITSKQSLTSVYEKRKLGLEELQLIFGGFVQAMEEMAEYLLNPGQLVLDPEYIYVDVEKKSLFFCYLPGYEKEVREQFQAFTEYILPKLDHEDNRAVILGYGVYRRALEDSFHLEHIKQELYQVREDKSKFPGRQESVFPEEKKNSLDESAVTGKRNNIETDFESVQDEEEKNGDIWSEDLWNGGCDDQKVNRKKKNSQKENRQKNRQKEKKGQERSKWEKDGSSINRLERENFQNTSKQDHEKEIRLYQRKKCVQFMIAIVIVTGIMVCVLAANYLGYLPWLSVEITMGVGIVFLGIGIVAYLISRHKIQREEENWRENISNNRKMSEEKEVMESANDQWTIKKEKNIPNVLSEEKSKDFGETTVLSSHILSGPASLVSREPGELATIYLKDDLTIIGKMETACDAVISLPTVSRVHAKIRKREDMYYLSDLNSRNGTSVNGRMLTVNEEYLLQDEDEVDFAQARYVFLQ